MNTANHNEHRHTNTDEQRNRHRLTQTQTDTRRPLCLLIPHTDVQPNVSKSHEDKHDKYPAEIAPSDVTRVAPCVWVVVVERGRVRGVSELVRYLSSHSFLLCHVSLQIRLPRQLVPWFHACFHVAFLFHALTKSEVPSVGTATE